MAKDSIGRNKPAKIKSVRVIMPQTPEGLAEARRRMIQFNTDVLTLAMEKFDLPVELKQEYLDSLHGIVPWAHQIGKKPDLECT